MNTYEVSKKQSKNNSLFLRIMVYAPYISKLKKLQSCFPSNSDLFFYLCFKYKTRLEQLNIEKKSSKKIYQEKTSNYVNIGIRVAPGVHQLLLDFSYTTGYSISALVRLLIEWESNLLFVDQIVSDIDDSHKFFGFHQQLPNEIVITEGEIIKMEIKHTFLIQEEKVEEIVLWEFK